MGLYSHYDGAHNHPVNRALHLIAIPVGFSSIIVVWFHWIIGLLLVPTDFALAWLGHLIEETNLHSLPILCTCLSLQCGWRKDFLENTPLLGRNQPVGMAVLVACALVV